MFAPLLITLAGVMDRIRGDSFHIGSRVVDKLLYGWVLAALFAHPWDWLTPLIAAGFAAGSSPGWGDSWGAILEKRDIPETYTREHWWQVGVLRTNKWLAGITRGLLWGAPVSILGVFDPVLYWAAPIYVVAYVGGAWVTSNKPFNGNWEHGEINRGLLAGLLVYAVTWMYTV